MTPKKLFAIVATGEAITWSLLLSGLAVRAFGAAPDWLIPLVGGTHGFMFLSYAVVATLVSVNQRWPLGRSFAAVALAVVPLATVPFDRSLLRRNLLEGSWRTERSDHPKDAGWFDSFFQWFIRRPLVLIAALLVAVVVIFVTLLWLGPPYEWFD
jgi:integral membrane protein